MQMKGCVNNMESDRVRYDFKDISTYVQRFAFLFVLSAFVFLNACATEPVSKNTEVTLLDGNLPIVVFNPVVRYKSIDNEVSVDQSRFDKEKIAEFISRIAETELTDKGFNVSTVQSRNNEVLTELENESRTNKIKVFRSKFNNETSRLLDSLRELTGGACALFVKADIHVGPGGWWDPNSGAIRMGMNRTVIKAKMIDTSSKVTVWKNEVQYREKPSVENEHFRDAVTLAFGNLDKKGRVDK